MANLDFSNIKEATPETNPFSKMNEKLNKESQVNKREKEVEVDGEKYIIKRWTNTELFQRLPTVANLLFVTTTAPMMEASYATETGIEYDQDLVDQSQIVALLFSRMQDLDVAAWMRDTLGKVYKQGSSKPVDFDEDFEDPRTAIKVVAEVLQANFMIQLCSDLLNLTPQLMMATEMKMGMEASSTT